MTNRQLITRLTLMPLAMFGFGFALIPLYDVFCDITGLNGKPDLNISKNEQSQYSETSPALHPPHPLIIQFTASSDHQWQFAPEETSLSIITGSRYRTEFSLSNPTNQTMSFTAIPSVSPGLAAEYLIKTECFCFQKQILAPGQTVNMPVAFTVRNDIPEDFPKMTLAYRLYASPE